MTKMCLNMNKMIKNIYISFKMWHTPTRECEELIAVPVFVSGGHWGHPKRYGSWRHHIERLPWPGLGGRGAGGHQVGQMGRTMLQREREMFYLTTHSTHFIYGYMASDIWLRTILIVRKEREREMFYLTMHSTHFIYSYMASDMVKDHSDSEKGNPLPPQRLLLSINSKGSFICTIPQTG